MPCLLARCLTHSLADSLARCLTGIRLQLFVPALAACLALVAADAARAQAHPDDIPAIRPLRTQGLPMELAALLLSGQQGGPVPFEVLPLVTPTGDGQGQVIVVFDIGPLGFQLPTANAAAPAGTAPGETANETDCGGTRKVEIMLYATAEGGAVRDSLLQTFEIDTHRVAPCLLDAGARFVGRLDLPPGDVSLRALVRIGGEHLGLRVVPLRVGPSGQVVTAAGGESTAAWLSPPLVFGLADDRPTLYEVTGGGAPVTQPPAGLDGVPAADPVVRRDETVEVKVLASGLERIGSEWRAVIQDDGGKILGQAPAKLTYGASDGDVRVLKLEFDTVGFPVGQVLLSMQSGSLDAAPAATAPPAPERTPESGEGPAWRIKEPTNSLATTFDRGDATETGPSGLVVTPPVRLTVVADRAAAFTTDLTAGLPDDYDPTAAQARRAATDVARQILPSIRDALDSGDWAAARDGITQVASQVGSAYGQEGLNQLGRETLEIFRGSRMLPAAVLHYDVYREGRRLREFLVSTYAREVMVASIRALEEDTQTSNALTASFYALLGAELQSAGLVRFSTAMLQRAVELDPRQSAARLSVAINYEQLGLMEEAAKAFDDLLDLQPDNEVAALRRAVALRHLGRSKAAREVLESLIDQARDAWVLAVAYQELAMVRLASDGPPAARDLLRQAIQRLPREPRLYLQLAFVLDTLGQHEAALATLDDMRLRTETGGGYTPRHRLTQWSTDATAGLESQLRALANERLTSLQSSGAATNGPGGAR